MKSPLSYLLASVCFALFAAVAAAQGPSADLSGVVVSPDGLRLPGATVLVRGAGSGRTIEVVANGQGAYRVSSLLPGVYDVTAAMAGFETVTRAGVEIRAGEPAVVDLTLPVAGIQEMVTVAATLPRESLATTEVRASSGRDIGEALSEVPGLTKVRKGGIASDVVLRGYQGRNLTVLIDGVRLYGACPNTMDPTAFHADFAEVERIDVGKGPFDVRNQGSLGGVLNVVTKRPQAGMHLDAAFASGSAGFVNPTATVAFASAGWSALGGASYRRASPFVDGAGRRMTDGAGYKPDQVSSTAFSVGTAWAKGYLWSGTPRSLQVAYTRQDASHVLYPYLQMDAPSDVADRASVTYQAAFNGRPLDGVRAEGYYSHVRHWMTDELRTSAVGMSRPYSMATDARTAAAGGKVAATLGRLDIGAEVFQREWTSTTMMGRSGYQPQYAIPSGIVRSAGVFAEHSAALTGRLSLDLGARLDRVHSFVDSSRANTDLYFAYQGVRSTSATDLAPAFKARATVQAAPGLEVSGGIGRTVRVPDPQERYFALKKMGSDWVGNPALRPATNTGVDVSASYRNARLSLNASGYLDVLRDFVSVYRQVKVQAAPGVMNAQARSYANVNARMRGGEADAAFSFTDRLVLSGNLSYTRGTRDPVAALGIVSTDLPEMPAARATLGLQYRLPRFTAELEGVAVGSQRYVDTDLNEAPTPGYAVMNARASWTAGRVRVRAALTNALGRDYYEHLSYQRDPFRSGVRVHEPGRTGYLNVGFAF